MKSLEQRVPFYFASTFFLGFCVYAIWQNHNSFNTSSILILLLLLLALGLWQVFQNKDDKHFSRSEKINVVSAAVIGTFVTYYLSVFLHMNTVMAASLVGLVGYGISQFLAKHQLIDLSPVIYCGSFVGMASASVLSLPAVLLAGLIAGLLFLFLCNVFNGCGGKLGSIAFISCVMMVALMYLGKGIL